MLTKSVIQFFRNLKEQPFRKEEHAFLVEGPKMVSELLESSFKINGIYGLPDYLEPISAKLSSRKVPYTVVNQQELQKISTWVTPNQVIAVVSFPTLTMNWNLISNDLTLVLDGIQDPGNLGTILRIADWYGIEQVICSRGSVDVFNPKVVQATMGSIFRVQVLYEDLVAFLTDLPPEIPVYGACLNGNNLQESELSHKGVIVIGSEAHGISEILDPLLTHRIVIPSFSRMKGKLGPESLNAAVAAGILCHAFRTHGIPGTSHC